MSSRNEAVYAAALVARVYALAQMMSVRYRRDGTTETGTSELPPSIEDVRCVMDDLNLMSDAHIEAERLAELAAVECVHGKLTSTPCFKCGAPPGVNHDSTGLWRRKKRP